MAELIAMLPIEIIGGDYCHIDGGESCPWFSWGEGCELGIVDEMDFDLNEDGSCGNAKKPKVCRQGGN